MFDPLQVKHEAVDFLREKALKTMSCLHITAAGEGKPQIVRVEPPLLTVGGRLPIEKTWRGTVTLRNTSTAMVSDHFEGYRGYTSMWLWLDWAKRGSLQSPAVALSSDLLSAPPLFIYTH